jgi:hypothetical protein
MNKRYKIEGTHLLYRLAEILFKVNLKTIAQFLKQNSAQLNIDWRGCNPQPRSGAASAIIGGGRILIYLCSQIIKTMDFKRS